MGVGPDDRPLVSRRHYGAWLVLLATVPLGLGAYVRDLGIGLFSVDPGERFGINFRTFHYAAERARRGAEFYDVPPPDTVEWAVYLYQPVTIVVFYPFTLLEWTTGFAIMTLLSIGAAIGATWLIVRYLDTLGVTLGWVDISLVLAAFLLSTHAQGTIYFGNINLILAFAVVIGFWATLIDRETIAGIAFAVSAIFKLFPALLGLWLLRRRQWTGIGVAIGTGIVALVLGILIFGLETTRYYLTAVMTGRSEAEQFVGGYPLDGTNYVTIQQPVSHIVSTIWPSAPYEAILGVTILVCIAILGYFYVDIQTELDRQMAIFATIVVAITAIPSLRWYLIMLLLPLVTVLYLWREGRARIAFLVGGVLLSITASSGDVVGFLALTPSVFEALASPFAVAANPPLYGIALMLAACAWHKYRTRARRRAEPTDTPQTPQYRRVSI